MSIFPLSNIRPKIQMMFLAQFESHPSTNRRQFETNRRNAHSGAGAKRQFATMAIKRKYA
jgi:hypothetical protein